MTGSFKRGFIGSALLLPVLLLLFAGCDDSGTTPISPGPPSGSWLNVQTYTIGGTEMRRTSNLTILSQTEGSLIDTVFGLVSGEWTVDSVIRVDLRFNPVGDGYQRTYEIHMVPGSAPDTTLRYWYLFRRGDSLVHYIGMRFLGANAGLTGEWRNDPADTAFLGLCHALKFTDNSVVILDDCGTPFSEGPMYDYEVDRDTLKISGRQLYGARFEVVPGWSLYLTARPSVGYRKIK